MNASVTTLLFIPYGKTERRTYALALGDMHRSWQPRRQTPSKYTRRNIITQRNNMSRNIITWPAGRAHGATQQCFKLGVFGDRRVEKGFLCLVPPSLQKIQKPPLLILRASLRSSLESSFHCAARTMRVMSCGVRILLDPEGKPEANGTRPRRRNPRKYGRGRAERRSQISACKIPKTVPLNTSSTPYPGKPSAFGRGRSLSDPGLCGECSPQN